MLKGPCNRKGWWWWQRKKWRKGKGLSPLKPQQLCFHLLMYWGSAENFIWRVKGGWADKNRLRSENHLSSKLVRESFMEEMAGGSSKKGQDLATESNLEGLMSCIRVTYLCVKEHCLTIVQVSWWGSGFCTDQIAESAMATWQRHLNGMQSTTESFIFSTLETKRWK